MTLPAAGHMFPRFHVNILFFFISVCYLLPQNTQVAQFCHLGLAKLLDTIYELQFHVRRRTKSTKLPRHKRMPSTQPPTNRHSLPIHITTLLTPQKQSHTRNLIRHRSSAQGIQLPNLVLRPSGPRSIVHDFCHARLNHTGTDCVDPDPGARELVACCLRDVDDGRFGGGVVRSSGVGAYACY